MLMRQAARPIKTKGQRAAELAPFATPIGGWISNRSLAQPEEGPQGAAVLENYFPVSTGAVLRRGSAIYVQVSEAGLPVRSIFKYAVGAVHKFFGATDEAIYDITTIINPVGYLLGFGDIVLGEPEDDYNIGTIALEGADVWTGTLGGDWHVVQFATTGGIYLVGVNGASVGFIYDGMAFYPNVPGGVWSLGYDDEVAPFTAGETVTGGTSGATATIWKVEANRLLLTDVAGGPFQDDETITSGAGEATANAPDGEVSVVPGMSFPDGSTLTTADMAFVWVYKNTLWFAQKESLSAWCLDVDSIGGVATEWPLGGEFGLGGSLLLGQSWSLSSSGQGGLSEQCVFLSTEGEIVVYQGLHPDVENGWSKVGTYRIGAPMGRRAFIRAGGDLIFATTIGFVALSTAVQVDMAALAPRAVSFAIADAWNDAVSRRGKDNWVCALWPESQMVAVAPPTVDSTPLFLASNAQTGAWAPFTNWDAICMEVFNGRLFFGTPDGYVIEAMVGGTDRGIPFTGTYIPLFSDLGKPTAPKIARQAVAEIIAATEINERLSCRADYDLSIPASPDVAPVPVGSEWDNAIWDQSIWSSERLTVNVKRRHSVSAYGYRLAPVLQITSGAAIPLDAKIISIGLTYETGGAFS